MIYLLKVNMLVAGAMFGLAGLFIAGLFVWTEAKKCAQAFGPMQRAIFPRTRTNHPIECGIHQGLSHGSLEDPFRRAPE